ncbi:MAG TPA: hypothetical protein VHV31_08995, partial [Nitrolancea sp.]|nr:hypothetical protein [Nitrolancea sp.]
DNRIFALREMVAHGHFNPDAIGTFAWRLGVYRTAIDQIEARNPVEDVVGSGTSSGAKVILEFNPTAFHANTIDANRSLHDEFLRAFYEWGIIGEALFLAFLGSLVMGLVRQTRAAGFETTWPFWGLLPTLGLGLLVENVLAGSGTPVGTGFVLVIAYVAVAATFTAREAEVVRARSGRTQFLPATGR